MAEIVRFLGVVGIVLLVFGVVPYAMTGRFDLWTAVHATGGAILLACSVILEFPRLRRAVASRGVRETARAATGSLLFAGLLVTANVVAIRHPWRYDATEDRVRTLSGKSRALAAHLGREVEVIAFIEAGSPDRVPLRDLMDRFAAASSGITWRFADPVQEPELAERFGVRQPGVVIATAGDGSSRAMRDASSGWSEGAIANLLRRATRSGPDVIYVLTGHGEASVGDLETSEGLGALARVLEAESFAVRPLALLSNAGVPQDAVMVIVAGPIRALEESELGRVRSYLERGGRMLALVEPGPDGGLSPLLAEYGVSLGSDVVVDPSSVARLGPRAGLAPIVEDFPEHPATRGFSERIVLDRVRSVGATAMGPESSLGVTILARTSARSWAERDLESLAQGRPIAEDAGDAPGPVSVAVASQAASHDTRLVVVGDSSLARNAGLGRFSNRRFLVNAIEWLAGNDDLVAEGPRHLRASRLDLTEADYRNLFRLSVLLFPEAVLIMGLGVWWRRRSL